MADTFKSGRYFGSWALARPLQFGSATNNPLQLQCFTNAQGRAGGHLALKVTKVNGRSSSNLNQPDEAELHRRIDLRTLVIVRCRSFSTQLSTMASARVLFEALDESALNYRRGAQGVRRSHDFTLAYWQEVVAKNCPWSKRKLWSVRSMRKSNYTYLHLDPPRRIYLILNCFLLILNANNSASKNQRHLHHGRWERRRASPCGTNGILRTLWEIRCE